MKNYVHYLFARGRPRQGPLFCSYFGFIRDFICKIVGISVVSYFSGSVKERQMYLERIFLHVSNEISLGLVILSSTLKFMTMTSENRTTIFSWATLIFKYYELAAGPMSNITVQRLQHPTFASLTESFA